MDRAAAVSKGTAGGGTQVIYDSARSVFVGNLPFDTQVSFFILDSPVFCLSRRLCFYVSARASLRLLGQLRCKRFDLDASNLKLNVV